MAHFIECSKTPYASPRKNYSWRRLLDFMNCIFYDVRKEYKIHWLFLEDALETFGTNSKFSSAFILKLMVKLKLSIAI